MNSHPDQKLLALYAGGELAARKRSALTAHLHSCSKCQSVLADLQSTRELLALAFSEPGDLDLRSVHEALAQRLGEQAPKADHRLWLAASFSVAVIAIAFVLNRNPLAPATKPKEQIAQIQNLPPLLRPAFRLPSRVIEPQRVRARKLDKSGGMKSIVLLARRDGPSQLRLSTADPNVVILIDLNGATHTQ